jgi:hypothetical protein
MQEPSIMHSHFSRVALGSRSRKHARIDVEVETHCSPELIMGAMQWLSKKGGITGQHEGFIIIAFSNEDKVANGLA